MDDIDKKQLLEFVDGDWRYTYTQEGNTSDFYGYEEISYKGEKVFWHRAVGGILEDRTK